MHILTEEMFKTGQPVSQGEVNIWMKKYAPSEVLEAVKDLRMTEITVTDQLIVGHSESGHHHVLESVEADPLPSVVRALVDAANDTWMFLTTKTPVVLRHQRSTDTHKAFVLPPGEYIRGLREEQVVEGWRRVAD